jgi:pyruvate dehydrogenase E1 component alpha subunit
MIDMYRSMLKIRWFERTVIDSMLTVKGFRGYSHAYCGQEGVAVGICAALNKRDFVFGNHRSHGHNLAKGADLKTSMAEIDMRATGLNKGYGGSMHLTDPSSGVMGADGIVGPGALFAAGAAYGIKVRGTDQVAVVFGGDGHVNTPWFHLAMNEAANFNLPFIYVIENNLYQIHQRYTNTCALKDLADRAKGYGMPGYVVDGQDVLAVYNVAKDAADKARAKGGPTLIEAKTYRYYDHFGMGGAKAGKLGAFGLDYRSDSEVRHWLNKDPIVLHRRTLVDNGVLTDEKAAAIETEVRNEAKAALDFTLASPLCTPQDGLKNVYATGTVPARQLA